MTIYTLVHQTSGGRTGHKMKDFLTAYCLYFLFNWKIMYDETWKKHPTENHHDNHCDMFNLTNSKLAICFDSYKHKNFKVVTLNKTSWVGLAIEDILEIKKNVERVNGENIIIKIVNATRISPHQLYNWGYKKEYFLLIETLKQLYDTNVNSLCIKRKFNVQPNNISITVHIRKGDVYNRYPHVNIDYYKNIILRLSKHFDNKLHTFNIISEKWHGYDEKDVRSLKNLNLSRNSTINIYMDFCLYEYFDEFINSDVLVLTNGQGSYSDLSILYSKQSSYILLCKKLRHYVFNDTLNNRFIYCNEDGSFDNSLLLTV